MWKRILRPEDLKDLSEGDVILNYPVTGKPVNSIDLSDSSNLVRYEIYSINFNTHQVDLRSPDADMPDPSQVLGMGNINGVLYNPATVNKQLDKLVEEQKWWIEVG
jgi:hypothetical protein